VKSTQAYAAKRALFDALTVQAAPGMPLDGVQVAYEYPARDLTRKVIYGGGVRFTHEDLAGEWGEIVNETVTVGVYVRVLRPDADVKTVEADVEALADQLTALFAAQPQLGGTMTWLGIAAGHGDYSRGPDGPEAVLSLQVLVGAVLT
jgi:hypothetical protein